MISNRWLVVDTFCEMYPALADATDETFWNLELWEPRSGCVLVVSRQTLNQHHALIQTWAEQQLLLPVLVNPTEGSHTMRSQCQSLGLLPLIQSGQLLLVGCGNMEPELNCLLYDCYLNRVIGYEENVQQGNRVDEIYNKPNKPYKFLFLNGRTRPHRKYMIEKMRDADLLEHAIWTNLDSTPVYHHTYQSDLLLRPSTIQLLPKKYEVERYHTNVQSKFEHSFIKHELFNNQWGDVYIRAEPYIDTYFSLVTETVFDYPYSLRSEKIYKPIAMGHPFVAVANYGFYRDLRNAGFQTYHSLIDESFDTIDNNQDRLDRIAQVVKDLCASDLNEFLVAAQLISKYNQQHMANEGPRIYREFPDRFLKFIQNNS